ncbi:TOBE domain-containing protein [Coleofasciculus sp. FACHB-64]|jgi:molybdopterin-binding protein|uniref:TOBE domain-containing protein n=1 Tax=Cyanophyceae TaxID=3028117 RepID=UPI00168596BF|nr:MULTISPECIES: TOBE domain-containing protein [unclassified Coleofasciculus]MBD1838126.1 TOBE domain-containing protein [Coleofasciculus sp. FACHB-501]MBD1881440.1 TOBE domain-containing protein [Coleofasciculus sp. FACHB-T130]MBD1899324.1 TOBE domain-containing protein [Coleofasciculus sp. FACHB-125]MBD1941536.1 TOBE domain-containing protein [Coleofasciculus sp. FACHB-712]MBD2046180.1 TOBE domain-containing protein [Coleofasciculus sp. FACHB-64]
MTMQISGRNQLRGKVTAIQLGDILAEVTIQVGDNLIDAVITRRSAENLQISVGDEVSALIKATEVMVIKEVD